MKRKLFKLFSVVVLATLTIALTACSGDKETASSSSITIGIPQDMEDSLDPTKAVAAGTKEIYFNIYEGLLKPDENGNLNPAIASEYSVSDDGLTYTFTLRDGVKFHDGTLVTAEDVVYSLNKCADAGMVSAFSNVTDISATDDGKVVITLGTPDVDFNTALASVNASIIPASNTDPDHKGIGTGPYKYVSRSPQENFILESFDDYWGEKAKIKHITLAIVANTDTIVMNLNSGAIDMLARVTSAQADQLNDNYEIYEGTMNLVQALYLNNAVEPFNDVRVRQALCYAVDKDKILDFVSDGHGSKIGSSMFPSFGKYYVEDLNNYYTRDLDKAKELLKEAGYENGFTFTITVPSNYTQHVDTAQVIAEQLKEIGVNAEISLIEWDSWLSDVYSGRNFQSTVIGVDASTLCANALLARFESTAHNNFTNFSSADYDEAFAKANAETDDAKRTQYYKDCEAILTKEAANVYIQDIAELVALNKKYAGYTFYPLYVQDFSKLYIVE
jgi:peptide/nickel transport system substrate-binding protein